MREREGWRVRKRGNFEYSLLQFEKKKHAPHYKSNLSIYKMRERDLKRGSQKR